MESHWAHSSYLSAVRCWPPVNLGTKQQQSRCWEAWTATVVHYYQQEDFCCLLPKSDQRLTRQSTAGKNDPRVMPPWDHDVSRMQTNKKWTNATRRMMNSLSTYFLASCIIKRKVERTYDPWQVRSCNFCTEEQINRSSFEKLPLNNTVLRARQHCNRRSGFRNAQKQVIPLP